jgi:hypothetical protein
MCRRASLSFLARVIAPPVSPLNTGNVRNERTIDSPVKAI